MSHCILLASALIGAAVGDEIRVGVASRDITPEGAIWLSGYSARDHASDGVAQRLVASAAAFDDGHDRFVVIALDNCEVSRKCSAPFLEEVQKKHGLPPDAVVIVSSHSHSAPCLEGVLEGMFAFEGVEKERVERYTNQLRADLVELVGAALADLRPASLARGEGTAGFAMNRRIYREDRVDFGENPIGPVDERVPVLRVTGPDGAIRAILFGYACHGTTIAGDDFYKVSGDYMAYAREHIEAVFPGAKALYLTGCGADTNPSPRGSLQFARQHGLELAGAVAGVLNRPLRPVVGPIRRAFERLELPLAPPPDRAKLVADADAKDKYVQNRARAWLALLDSGKPLPATVSFPTSVVRLGDELTFFFLGGEPVVDYALAIQSRFAADRPWTVGYAYEVPCYIPSQRILKEGGYEADSSLIYYGIYGPILGRAEEMILGKIAELVQKTRGK